MKLSIKLLNGITIESLKWNFLNQILNQIQQSIYLMTFEINLLDGVFLHKNINDIY